jgi:uncharacterized membrane protein
MEVIAQLFEVAASIVDVFGISLLILGFSRGAYGWVAQEIARLPWEKRLPILRKLRCIVGLHILFALELMIVSDIITSFIAAIGYQPGEYFFTSSVFYALIQLAMIVAIRTTIDFFLSKEMESIHDQPLAS